MKKWLSLLMIFGVIGCSSSVVEKRYYEITSDFSNKEASTPQVVTDLIWVESVSIANFLNQSGIIYQSSDVEYVTAANNLWVSSLSEQLKNRMIVDLSTLLPGRLVSGNQVTKPTTTIKLVIDGFHGSYSGDAIIKGRWIVTKDDVITVKNFNHALRLPADGYAALVKTLSKGWQEETIELVKTIKL